MKRAISNQYDQLYEKLKGYVAMLKAGGFVRQKGRLSHLDCAEI